MRKKRRATKNVYELKIEERQNQTEKEREKRIKEEGRENAEEKERCEECL